MNPPTPASDAGLRVSFEMPCQLRFASLFRPGCGVVVPCDASGTVNLDTLSERLRNAYLGARALVGREYAFPTVERAH